MTHVADGVDLGPPNIIRSITLRSDVMRRSGKYGCFVCHNGINGKHNCKSKGYKSIEHVEQTVLGEVLSRLSNPVLPAQICEMANRFLEDYASKPKTDTSDLDRQIRAEVRRRKALVSVIGDDESEDLDEVRSRLKKINAKIHELREEKSRADAQNETPPSSITADMVANELGDLRSLLCEDVTTASKIFKKLAGDVRISQVRNVGKRGWKWTAHFTMNLVPVLIEIQKKKDCPKTGIWEYLNTRGWTIQQKVVVEIGKSIAAEGFVPQVREILASLPDSNMSVNAMASALGTDWNTANAAMKLALGDCSGRAQLPDVRSKAQSQVEAYRSKHADLIQRVVRLRDDDQMSFPRITGMPLQHLKHLTKAIPRGYMLQPFGVIFDRDFAIEKWAQEVHYVSNNSARTALNKAYYDALADNFTGDGWQHLPYVSARHDGCDFHWEREWSRRAFRL